MDIHIDPQQTLLILVAGLMGGILRGYSGFGFAMAAVPVLGLGVPPLVAVPSVLIHELLIGAFSLRRERRSFSLPVISPLAFGSLVGTPIGLVILALVPSPIMKVAVTSCILVALTLLWRRQGAPVSLGRATLGTAGLISGMLNGATAMSGPPAIVVLVSSSLGPEKVRGLLTHFIFFSALIGVTLSLLGGLQTFQTLSIAGLMSPGVIVGTLLGMRAFRTWPQRHYRKVSLGALFVISALSLAAGVAALGQ